MQLSPLLALVLLSTTSLAIQVTSPSRETTWLSFGPNTVTWMGVDTDPTSFAVTLTQLGVYKQTLENNVSTAQGSVTITSILPAGNTFQVNLVKSSASGALNTILAQSAQFNITQGGQSSDSSSSETVTGSVIQTTNTVPASPTTQGASLGTNLPNASSTTLAPTKSNAASPSLQNSRGFLGVFVVLMGVTLV